MAFSASLVRPDRVYSTGVIAPYPIRTESPVTVARGTINPFVSEVRSTGPTLSGSDEQAVLIRTAAILAAKQMPAVSRVGNRPVAMRYGRPQVASTEARNVVVETQSEMPNYLRYLLRAARAGRRVRQANTYGSIWDTIFAKQHQLRALSRPGWGIK
jgi:hypothetical protein